MSYRIALKGSARKEFRALPPGVQEPLTSALDALGADPRPQGAETLAGELKGLQRIRVGEYRVIFHVDDAEPLVTVTRIRPRSTAYR